MAVDNHRIDGFTPYAYLTSDYGETWTDIGSSLPESPINEIVIDPTLPNHYYIATDDFLFKINGVSLINELGMEFSKRNLLIPTNHEEFDKKFMVSTNFTTGHFFKIW